MKTQRRLQTLGWMWVLAATVSLRAAAGQVITEYGVPCAGSHPLEIARSSEAIWFTDPGANQVGSITPDGKVTLFPARRPPSGIAAARDGNVWFTSDGLVSRITPSGVVTEYWANFPGYSDNPSIVAASDGTLWFTGWDLEGGRVGRVSASGRVDSRYIQSLLANDPTGIAVGADGNLWVTVFGAYGDSTINRIAPAGVVDGIVFGRTLTEFRLPGSRGVWAITPGPDGNLWFTETNANKIGRITLAGEITEFPVSGNPRGITAGADGNLWFTEETGNRIGRITPAGDLAEFPIPTPDSRPWGISAGPDGNIWFTERDGGRIGKVSLPCGLGTLCLSAGRYQLSVTYETSAGVSGTGHPVALTSDAGYFWFFDPANVEVVVKVLDGCSINSRKWLFAAGLTNVRVILVVTDVRTGRTKTYINPQGVAMAPIQDTDALSTCP